MSITFGDRLTDSGYHDITPEQERERDLEREIEHLKALNADAHAIVDRIWAIFGTPSYDSLAGRTIYDLVEASVKDAEGPKLQPIETAPSLERIMVAGWQQRSGTVAGYWWYHEDCVDGGKAIDTPHATHWFPIVTPVFPASVNAGV